MNIIKLIKAKIFKVRLDRAIKKANRLHNKTGFKFLVLNFKGKPVVRAKKDLKHAIRLKQFDCNIHTLEKIALYASF